MSPAPSSGGSGVGTGYENFNCGPLWDVILEDVDPSTVRGNPVYQCCFFENNYLAHQGRSGMGQQYALDLRWRDGRIAP